MCKKLWSMGGAWNLTLALMLLLGASQQINPRYSFAVDGPVSSPSGGPSGPISVADCNAWHGQCINRCRAEHPIFTNPDGTPGPDQEGYIGCTHGCNFGHELCVNAPGTLPGPPGRSCLERCGEFIGNLWFTCVEACRIFRSCAKEAGQLIPPYTVCAGSGIVGIGVIAPFLPALLKAIAMCGTNPQVCLPLATVLAQICASAPDICQNIGEFLERIWDNCSDAIEKYKAYLRCVDGVQPVLNNGGTGVSLPVPAKASVPKRK